MVQDRSAIASERMMQSGAQLTEDQYLTAIENTQLLHLESLLEALPRNDPRSPLNWRNRSGQSLVALASARGNIDLVQTLLRFHADPNLEEGRVLQGNWNNALHLALGSRADPSNRDPTDADTLRKLIATLLEAGCNPWAENAQGTTPYHYATMNGARLSCEPLRQMETRSLMHDFLNLTVERQEGEPTHFKDVFCVLCPSMTHGADTAPLWLYIFKGQSDHTLLARVRLEGVSLGPLDAATGLQLTLASTDCYKASGGFRFTGVSRIVLKAQQEKSRRSLEGLYSIIRSTKGRISKSQVKCLLLGSSPPKPAEISRQLSQGTLGSALTSRACESAPATLQQPRYPTVFNPSAQTCAVQSPWPTAYSSNCGGPFTSLEVERPPLQATHIGYFPQRSNRVATPPLPQGTPQPRQDAWDGMAPLISVATCRGSVYGGSKGSPRTPLACNKTYDLSELAGIQCSKLPLHSEDYSASDLSSRVSLMDTDLLSTAYSSSSLPSQAPQGPTANPAAWIPVEFRVQPSGKSYDLIRFDSDANTKIDAVAIPDPPAPANGHIRAEPDTPPPACDDLEAQEARLLQRKEQLERARQDRLRKQAEEDAREAAEEAAERDRIAREDEEDAKQEQALIVERERVKAEESARLVQQRLQEEAMAQEQQREEERRRREAEERDVVADRDRLERLRRQNSEARREEENSMSCPISYDIMVDPVLLMGDGHSYERKLIEEWLACHNTSPVTGMELPAWGRVMHTNYALRSVIAAWRARGQDL